jgi:hypothetical protein
MRGLSRSRIVSPVIGHHLQISLRAGCPEAAKYAHRRSALWTGKQAGCASHWARSRRVAARAPGPPSGRRSRRRIGVLARYAWSIAVWSASSGSVQLTSRVSPFLLDAPQAAAAPTGTRRRLAPVGRTPGCRRPAPPRCVVYGRSDLSGRNAAIRSPSAAPILSSSSVVQSRTVFPFPPCINATRAPAGRGEECPQMMYLRNHSSAARGEPCTVRVPTARSRKGAHARRPQKHANPPHSAARGPRSASSAWGAWA